MVGVLLGSSATLALSRVFSDVPANEWFSASVNSLSEKGIVNGYSDGTFRPSNSVNRAELAVMLDKTIQYLQNNPASSNQTSAQSKCIALGGNPYTSFSEESGQNEVFCKFGSEGECTQNELNGGTCFKDR